MELTTSAWILYHRCDSLSKHSSCDAKTVSWPFSYTIPSLDFVYASTSLCHHFHHGYQCFFIIYDRHGLRLQKKTCFFVVILPDRCPRLHAQSEQNDTFFFFLDFLSADWSVLSQGGCTTCSVVTLLMISCAAHSVDMSWRWVDLMCSMPWSNVSAAPNTSCALVMCEKSN